MKKYFKNFFRYRFLLGELVKKGIKLKYRRSYLGIIWSLLEPLLTTIVLTIVFGTLFHNDSPEYPVYILIGRLLYSFYSQSTTACLKSIRSNSGLIKKVYMPKYLYPLSSVLFNYVIFLISLVVLIGLCVFEKITPSIHMFQVIIPLLILPLLSYACGMILATIGVFFRDMEYLWTVITMIIMYASAIFYSPDAILASKWGWILRYNPLYCLIANSRNAIFGEPMDVQMCVYSIAFSVVALIVGVVLFKKKQDEFILHI